MYAIADVDFLLALIVEQSVKAIMIIAKVIQQIKTYENYYIYK